MLPIPLSWRFAGYAVGLLATPEWTDDCASNGVVQLHPLTVYTVVSPVAPRPLIHLCTRHYTAGVRVGRKKKGWSHARRTWKQAEETRSIGNEIRATRDVGQRCSIAL